MSLVAEYVEAFQRCYPHKKIEVKLKKVGYGEWKHRVIIDKDPGDIFLTDDDLRSAIRLFDRGR